MKTRRKDRKHYDDLHHAEGRGNLVVRRRITLGFWSAEFLELRKHLPRTTSTDEWPKWIAGLRHLSRAGSPAAMVMLGDAHLGGLGVERSIPCAMSQYKKASRLRFAPTFRRIALTFTRGIGVERSAARAVRPLRRAVELGDNESRFLLGHHYLVRCNDSGKKRLGRNLIVQSARKGCPAARRFLALDHKWGFWTRKSATKSRMWWRRYEASPVDRRTLELLAMLVGE